MSCPVHALTADLLREQKDVRSFKRQLNSGVQQISQQIKLGKGVFGAFVKRLVHLKLLYVDTPEKAFFLSGFWDGSGFARIEDTIQAVATQVTCCSFAANTNYPISAHSCSCSVTRAVPFVADAHMMLRILLRVIACTDNMELQHIHHLLWLIS